MTQPTLSFMRVQKDGAVMVEIHVIPNASRTQADGMHDGALRVRLHAPPVDGKANTALTVWLAETLKVPKNQVTLERSLTSKRKHLQVSASATAHARWAVLRDQAMAKDSRV